ncbi:MAG: hypothetical protein J0H40_09875 [Rhizobiales bacterium]|nr:hypothetical protein [Hyphomicrobiales bacterium]
MHVKKILGFAAVGALLAVVAPAQAATPVNPGIATTTQSDAGKLTTEVRYHHRRHWRPRHWHRRHWHRRHHRRW